MSPLNSRVNSQPRGLFNQNSSEEASSAVPTRTKLFGQPLLRGLQQRDVNSPLPHQEEARLASEQYRLGASGSPLRRDDPELSSYRASVPVHDEPSPPPPAGLESLDTSVASATASSSFNESLASIEGLEDFEESPPRSAPLTNASGVSEPPTLGGVSLGGHHSSNSLAGELMYDQPSENSMDLDFGTSSFMVTGHPDGFGGGGVPPANSMHVPLNFTQSVPADAVPVPRARAQASHHHPAMAPDFPAQLYPLQQAAALQARGYSVYPLQPPRTMIPPHAVAPPGCPAQMALPALRGMPGHPVFSAPPEERNPAFSAPMATPDKVSKATSKTKAKKTPGSGRKKAGTPKPKGKTGQATPKSARKSGAGAAAGEQAGHKTPASRKGSGSTKTPGSGRKVGSARKSALSTPRRLTGSPAGAAARTPSRMSEPADKWTMVPYDPFLNCQQHEKCIRRRALGYVPRFPPPAIDASPIGN